MLHGIVVHKKDKIHESGNGYKNIMTPKCRNPNPLDMRRKNYFGVVSPQKTKFYSLLLHMERIFKRLGIL